MDNRHQNQRWFVRLWRLRYLLPVPFCALRAYCGGGCSLSDCWVVAVGDAEEKMQHWYTLDEVFEGDNG